MTIAHEDANGLYRWSYIFFKHFVFGFRAMGDFKTCYKPKAAECSGDVVFSMTFGTIENTIEYLCVEGYQG